MREKLERVRALNDDLRQSHRGGRLMLTPGIQALDAGTIQRIDVAIANYDAFSTVNDPYDEHDFGSITIGPRTILFKIDYFDRELLRHSEDPSDPAVTSRVMTIMLAEEY